jgi:hypothetical protein
METPFPTTSPERFRALVENRETVLIHDGDNTYQRIYLGFGAGYVSLLRHDPIEYVAEVARQSYTPAGKREVPRLRSQNIRLAQSLVLDNHSGPLGFMVFDYDFEAPKTVFDHLVRYNMAKKSVSSGRYARVPRKAYAVPQEIVDACWDSYESRLAAGEDKELARHSLPVGQMVKFRLQLDLRCLMNLLSQRLDPAAQDETRAFAWAMARLIGLVDPAAMKVISMELIWFWARQVALGGKRPRPTTAWVEALHDRGPFAILEPFENEHVEPAIAFLRAGVKAQDTLVTDLFVPDTL